MTVKDVALTQRALTYSKRTVNEINHCEDAIDDRSSDLLPERFMGGQHEALSESIIAQIGMPVSDLSVAAYLESRGWTDENARSGMNQPNLRSLGNEIWNQSWLLQVAGRRLGTIGRSTESSSNAGLQLRGIYLISLALVQMVALVWLGFSFGSGLGFSSLEATSAGIGMLLGLVWANSLGQLLAREPLKLHNEGNNVVAGLAAFRIVAIAVLLACGLAALVVGLLVANGGHLPTIVFGAGYFVLVSVFWLMVSTMLMFDLGVISIAATLMTLGLIIALQHGMGLMIDQRFVPALALALSSTVMVAAIMVWWLYQRWGAAPVRSLQGLRSVVIEQWGFVIYGLGIMILIVQDRFIAWQAGADSAGMVIKVRYEIGLGWALLAFLVMVAFQERLLAVFLQNMRLALNWTSATEQFTFAHSCRRSYRNRFVLLALAVASVGLLAYSLISLAPFMPQSWQHLMVSGDAVYVFGWGLVGYGILALAMMNTGLIIAMGQPERLILPMLAATLSGGMIAWWAATTFTYMHSVMGLVAGAAVLLVWSGLRARSILRGPAHALYASSMR